MRESKTQQSLLEALAKSLHGENVGQLPDDVLKEAKDQAVLPLICSSAQAFSYIAANVQNLWEQQELGKALQGIPYIVLKGACASIYYPEPMWRTLGDIDILVPPEHFVAAYRAIEKAGYITDDPNGDDNRHVHFARNHVLVELHHRYAILQTREQEQLLDQWLYEARLIEGRIGKYSFPMPNDQLNGLVLLAHINQHLEEGLGLRHLVDWCVYVQHCLLDDQWPAFQEKADMLGLTKIAKVVARFGQVYLGLYPEATWCADAKQQTVDALLDYVFECGNFGHKDALNNTMVMVMSHGRGVRGFFRNLQLRGMANWQLLKKAPWLKPVAWFYQLCRYVHIGLKGGGLRHFRQNVLASKERNKLMDELGATRVALRK